MTGLPLGPRFFAALARDTGKMRRHFPHVVAIMTAQGHLLFSVTCTLLAHKLQLTPALADAKDNWDHFSDYATYSLAATALALPAWDKDWEGISKPLSRLFGHRGFTHSLLAVAAAIWGLDQSQAPALLPTGVKDALIIGYLSHLLGDWLTPAGIPLLWPSKRRYRLPGWPLKSGGAVETGFCTLTLLAAGYWAHWPG